MSIDQWKVPAPLGVDVTEAPESRIRSRDWWRSLLLAVLVHATLLAIWGWMAWTPLEPKLSDAVTHWVDWRPGEPVTASEARAPLQSEVAGQTTPPAANPITSPMTKTEIPRHSEARLKAQPSALLAVPVPRTHAPVSEVVKADDQIAIAATEPLPRATESHANWAPTTTAPGAEPPVEAAVQTTAQPLVTQVTNSTSPPVSTTDRAALAAAQQRKSPLSEAARIQVWLSANAKPQYPVASRRLGEQGTVELILRFDAQAKLQAAVIARSSGYPRLDQAALRVAQNWRYPEDLRPFTGPQDVRVPVVFSLASP